MKAVRMLRMIIIDNYLLDHFDVMLMLAHIWICSEDSGLILLAIHLL